MYIKDFSFMHLVYLPDHFQTCEKCGVQSQFIPDIAKCQQLAEGPGLHVAAVGQPSTFTVYVVDRNGKESQHWVRVSCNVWYYECVGKPWRVVLSEVRRVTKSQYVISYIPRNWNQHNIHITIEGEPLLPVTLRPAAG